MNTPTDSAALSAQKIYDADGGVALDDWLAALPRPLVFTNGCFDVLHRGHVDCLQQAAALGAALLVGVNSDASVRRLNKTTPPARPLNPLADRAAVLAALASVTAVVAFDEPTPLALITRAQPDHLVKGGDWPPEQIVGADAVTATGGKVHAIPHRFHRSTTNLIHRVRSD